MKKYIKRKRNYKIILGMIISILILEVVGYAPSEISSLDISYDNSNSGLKSTTLEETIDEAYKKTDIRKIGKFVAAYT